MFNRNDRSFNKTCVTIRNLKLISFASRFNYEITLKELIVLLSSLQNVGRIMQPTFEVISEYLPTYLHTSIT